jgi:hypothetical protein
MVGHALWLEKCPNNFHEDDGQYLAAFHLLGCYILCSESLVEVDRLTVKFKVDKVDRQQVEGQG